MPSATSAAGCAPRPACTAMPVRCRGGTSSRRRRSARPTCPGRTGGDRPRRVQRLRRRARRARRPRRRGTAGSTPTPRDGKRGGAFCMSVAGDRSLVLLNWTGGTDSTRTVAHELGHAFHNTTLAARTPLQRRLPMALAETASIFCETLVVDAGLRHADGDTRLALLDADLRTATQLVVDIRSRFVFEHAVFDRRRRRALGVSELDDLMLAAQAEAYGDGLDQATALASMWIVKPHYYGSHFYNWPYTYGLLFGLGLFSRYRDDPDRFRDGYEDLLSRAGMDTAEDLGAGFGLDVTDEAFWQASLDVLRGPHRRVRAAGRRADRGHERGRSRATASTATRSPTAGGRAALPRRPGLAGPLRPARPPRRDDERAAGAARAARRRPAGGTRPGHRVGQRPRRHRQVPVGPRRRRPRRDGAHAVPGPGHGVRVEPGRVCDGLRLLRHRSGRVLPPPHDGRDRRAGRARRRAGPATAAGASATSCSWAWASRSPTRRRCGARSSGCTATSGCRPRHITISTVGIVPGIRRLAERAAPRHARRQPARRQRRAARRARADQPALRPRRRSSTRAPSSWPSTDGA